MSIKPLQTPHSYLASLIKDGDILPLVVGSFLLRDGTMARPGPCYQPSNVIIMYDGIHIMHLPSLIARFIDWLRYCIDVIRCIYDRKHVDS